MKKQNENITSISISEDVKAKLKEKAKSSGMKLYKLLDIIISDWLDKQEQ